jgi:hypothetical protein
MKNFRRLLLLISALPVVAFSQTSYVKAYLVNMKGDTVKGEARVNPKKEYDNYYKILFRDSAGTQKTYKPEKIKAFGFGDQHYVAITEDGETAFFRVLARGHVNLYKFMFEGIRMNKTVFVPEYYLAESDSSELEPIRENRFKKQLSRWIDDNPKLLETYDDTWFFEEKEAVKLIEDYNAWKASQKK